jgi:uncharacterized protein
MLYQDILLPVVEDWSFRTKQPPASVRRSALRSLPELQPDLVTVIQGVRRGGKSTLLAQIMEEQNLPRERCFFINFEDPRLSESLETGLLDSLVLLAQTEAPGEEPRYLFLDEIQVVQNWERWLRVRTDRPSNDRFVITGSNAALLSGELGSVLTGRHLSVELFPFSFDEYRKLRPDGDLKEYLLDGGFPRALSISDPPRLLRQYFIDIIERDVRSHVAARSSLLLMKLAKAIYESAGSELSARKLARHVEISTDSVLTYVDALTKSYLILPCPYFAFSERKQAARNSKWYPIDCGLRASVITSGTPDIGKSFETAVFHALRRRHQHVFFWRDRGEVDFVVLKGNTPQAIQVSWDGVKDRHRRAVDEFMEKFPSAQEPRFITQDNFSQVNQDLL